MNLVIRLPVEHVINDYEDEPLSRQKVTTRDFQDSLVYGRGFEAPVRRPELRS